MKCLTGLSFLLVASVIRAQDIPEPLKPWMDWATRDEQAELYCPPFAETRQCSWPGQVSLDVNDAGGRFVLRVKLLMDMDVLLPGDLNQWPFEVTADGKVVPVLNVAQRPTVFLKKGDWRIEGRFDWQSPPGKLRLPKRVATVRLTLFGVEDENPYRQDEYVLLSGAEQSETEDVQENSLRLRVWRTLIDSEPMRLETVLKLDVSGERRELDLGKVLPEGFVTYAINSDLPWRLLGERLQIQAEAGSWEVEMTAWSDGAKHFGPVHPFEGWPNQEKWFFEAQPELRSVVVTGGVALDPSRFEVPDFLDGTLPLYALDRESRLILDERTRGLAQLPPNQLNLNRTLWLDFNGEGYSFKDTLRGELQDVRRLEMARPFVLGAVRLDGSPQLITVLADATQPGVNLDSKKLNLEAEGRLTSKGGIPVAGWDAGLSQVTMDVRLPAGWKAMVALGSDQSSGTWMDSWNVWRFFWVLLTGIITSKLLGRRVGLLALLVMVLLHNEAGAPAALWFPLLAMIALGKVAKPAWEEKVRKGFYFFLVILLIPVIPFIRNQALWALYPESAPGQHIQAFNQGGFADEPAQFAEAEEDLGMVKKRALSKVNSASNVYVLQEEMLARSIQQNRSQIQMGPGLPSWDGNSLHLRWSGPITNETELRLILLSPQMSRLLTLLRIVGMLALIAALCGRRARFSTGKTAAKAGVLGLMALLAVGSLQAQDLPSNDLLEDMAEHLTKLPPCYPNCATIAKAHLVREGAFWQIQMEVHAGSQTVLALPEAGNQATINGKTPILARTDDALLMMVEAGVHRVNLDLYARRGLVLKFPLKPVKLTWRAEPNWRLEGVDREGRLIALPTLVYTPKKEQPDEDTWENTTLPAYAKIERRLLAGQEWIMETTIKVLSEAPFRGRVPIFSGEKFLEDEVLIEDGFLVVNVAGQNTVVLTSKLEAAPVLVWEHPQEAAYEARWLLDIDPIWHASWKGVPTIRFFDSNNTFSPSWTPRRGERMEMFFDRPRADEGLAFTYRRAALDVKPGPRLTEYELSLNYASAIGGEHAIGLPAGAEVGSFTLNGQTQPIRLEPEGLILNYGPGEGSQFVRFTLAEGLSARFSPAEVVLGQPGVNLEVAITLPGNRWILAAFGKGSGPMIMFWSILFVVLLSALVLDRFKFGVIGLFGWILLGLGLSQLHIYSSLIAVSWFALITFSGNRKCRGMRYNLEQVGLLIFTVIFGFTLMAVLYQGLLSHPNMYIYNWRNGAPLSWYLDRFDGRLPTYSVWSLPMWTYRLLMFGWALWLASALPKWIRAAWEGFSKNGVFQSKNAPSLSTNTTQDKDPETEGTEAQTPPTTEPKEPR